MTLSRQLPRSRPDFLSAIERGGNALPDLSFLLLGGIAVLMVLSALGAWLDWGSLHPVATGDAGNPVRVEVVSLISQESVSRLLVEMPMVVGHFHPLGMLLVATMGIAVAEKSGMISALSRAWTTRLPKGSLSLIVVGMCGLGNISADWAYVILIPLAGAVFAAAGRHPVAGIFAAFAGVAGAFSANLIAPTTLDRLLFGIAEAASQYVDDDFQANYLGNWYFHAIQWAAFTVLGWLITDRVVEPRLNRNSPLQFADHGQVSPAERRGLAAAGQTFLAFVVILTALLVWQGAGDADSTLSDDAVAQALVGMTAVGLIACGWAFGAASGTVHSHRDIVSMITSGFRDFAPVLLMLAVFSVYFAMLNWSNLGLVAVVATANFIISQPLPATAMVIALVVATAMVDFAMSSASAKLALFAPMFIPALALSGVTPEMTTAAYRLGDSVFNPISPTMVYFPIVLAFCRKWLPEFGLGSMLVGMLPFSLAFLFAGLLQVTLWLWLNLPLGPGSAALGPMP